MNTTAPGWADERVTRLPRLLALRPLGSPTGEEMCRMPEPVLPKLTRDETTIGLPSDPTALLTGDQQKDLSEGLAKLARLRRDAETASGSLRLA